MCVIVREDVQIVGQPRRMSFLYREYDLLLDAPEAVRAKFGLCAHPQVSSKRHNVETDRGTVRTVCSCPGLDRLAACQSV